MLSKEQITYLIKSAFTNEDTRAIASREKVREWLEDEEFRKKYFIALDISMDRTSALINKIFGGER